MQPDLKFEQFYPHPPERVWKALTDPSALAAWYMPNDFQPALGHQFTFRTDPAPGFDGVLRCEVIRLDPPRQLAYTFLGGWMNRPTVVTWSLLPQEGGTLLRLEHTGFSALDDPAIRSILEGGWGAFLPRIASVLATLATDDAR
jgi:uncharacterized protein YndB with AHSA1/START domain